MNKELFLRSHRAAQLAGAYVTGIVALEGVALDGGNVVPGFVAAGVIGTVNAILEAYKYRKYERNSRR